MPLVDASGRACRRRVPGAERDLLAVVIDDRRNGPAYEAGVTVNAHLVKPHGSVTPAFTVTLGATVRVSGGPVVPSPRVAETVPPTEGTKVALKAPLSSVTGLATVAPSTATVTVGRRSPA